MTNTFESNADRNKQSNDANRTESESARNERLRKERDLNQQRDKR